MLKKLLTAAISTAMVFCLSFGALAAPQGNDGSYIQTAADGSTGAINVTLSIEGLALDYAEIPVSLDANTDGATHKVVDAMIESEVATAGYTFYTSSTDGSGVTTYAPVTAASTYFSHVKKGDVYNGGSGQGFSGWVFRINGAFPMEFADWGATISTATIKDGDVISFYVDDPISEANSTKFTRINANYANGTVSATVTSSLDYFDASWNWEISDFVGLSGATVQVLNASGAVVGSAVSDIDGEVAITTGNLPAGTYTVKVVGNKTSTSIISTTTTSSFTV